MGRGQEIEEIDTNDVISVVVLEGRGPNSTLLTISKNSSKVPHCQDRWVMGQEIKVIDANEEISALALEGRGSELDHFDVFDEIENSSKAPLCQDRWVGVKKSKKSTQTKNISAGAGG